MNTKLFIVAVLILFSIKGFSQEEIKLAKKNGVKITYQLLLKEEGKKKDKYILIVNAVNETETDLLYKVPLSKNDENEWELPIIPEELGFTKIKVRNSTGIFGNGQSIIGEQSQYLTSGNSRLFVIRSGEIYSHETTFKVKSGDIPLITNSFSRSFKTLNNFDLKISSKMLNGDYTSSCGNIKLNISLQKSDDKGEYLIQTTNGKQFVWIRSNETTFSRENNSDYSLTFNKNNNTYTYSTSDGISCIWTK